MAHILVIGASRGIGLETVKRGLDLGHRMRGFARSKIEIENDAFEAVQGDATDRDDLTRALDGVDAVVLTLGIKESVSMIWKKVTLFSDATKALVPAMEQHGPDRLVCLTGIGTSESIEALSWVEKAGHSFLLGEPYKDKTRQEAIIRSSALRWTFARPVILTNGKRTETYKVLTDPKDWRMGIISRGDVADFLVKAATDDAMVGQAPVLTR
ncbi:NAD-dependent epimerase/dehydratase [Roseivivax marinus]|uniref:NAD-dependent epimerase/dehydratase n=1 Tax=Roseivivax marinus TaxID=1379903 RepID=W4HID1_9RHOB|nr:NAD(P)H-binding protein [Roseivivax marinus]ETW12497.1 NAD-dependent epimerase/dehydratase [Roseivivax marinus]